MVHVLRDQAGEWVVFDIHQHAQESVAVGAGAGVQNALHAHHRRYDFAHRYLHGRILCRKCHQVMEDYPGRRCNASRGLECVEHYFRSVRTEPIGGDGDPAYQPGHREDVEVRRDRRQGAISSPISPVNGVGAVLRLSGAFEFRLLSCLCRFLLQLEFFLAFLMNLFLLFAVFVRL